MKLKILKKSIKEGDNYCIKSLFVQFESEQTYNGIISHLKSQGAEDDKINSFCKPNEYNGKVSYAFGLNCSNFTFDKVQRFGILDANVLFIVNDKGYCNAKIQIIDRVEQVNGYEAPEDEAQGWNIPAPENIPPLGDGSQGEPIPILDPFANSLNPNDNNDLPF